MASDAAVARYPYPVDDPDSLRTAGTRVGNVSAALRDTGADVDDSTLLLSDSWQSQTAATAISDVRGLARTLPRDGNQLEQAATAVLGYVGALETAREDIERLRVRYDDAVAARDTANQNVPGSIPQNRWTQEEYRGSNQRQLETTTTQIDTEYDDVTTRLKCNADSASTDLTAVLDTLAPPRLRGAGGYGAAAYNDAALGLSLAATVSNTADPARRAAQSDAFEELFGREPSGPTDWSTAAMLDSTSHLAKNGSTDAIIRVGRVAPQPGRGLVRIGMYIPSAEVFNVPNYDLGDDRGPRAEFDPEAARVSLYIDYESGAVIARQNPSVNTEGEVRVDAPDIEVSETTRGAIRINYDAANPFAPPDPTDSHTVNGEVVVTPPGLDSDEWRLDGEIGDYPAFEAYHDDPLGRTEVLLQDGADNEGDFGPLLELPSHHDIGSGPESDAVKQFGDLGRPISGPYYEYRPREGIDLGTVEDHPRIDPWPPFGEESMNYDGTI